MMRKVKINRPKNCRNLSLHKLLKSWHEVWILLSFFQPPLLLSLFIIFLCLLYLDFLLFALPAYLEILSLLTLGLCFLGCLFSFFFEVCFQGFPFELNSVFAFLNVVSGFLLDLAKFFAEDWLLMLVEAEVESLVDPVSA